ncbi:unnamed protein product, partial [Prorocentrum cordatum]
EGALKQKDSRVLVDIYQAELRHHQKVNQYFSRQKVKANLQATTCVHTEVGRFNKCQVQIDYVGKAE